MKASKKQSMVIRKAVIGGVAGSISGGGGIKAYIWQWRSVCGDIGGVSWRASA